MISGGDGVHTPAEIYKTLQNEKMCYNKKQGQCPERQDNLNESVFCVAFQ